MMNSIFTPLDLNPQDTNQTSLYYLIVISTPMMLSQPIWLPPNNITNLKTKQLLVSIVLTSTSKLMHSKSAQSLIFQTFYNLTILNFLGMIPFIPPPTPHLPITLTMGSSLWMTLMAHPFLQNPKQILSTQIPESSPPPIGPFLSLVESVSNSIRPLTLSFRLAANISAGHIILGMMTTATAIPMMMSSPTKMVILLALVTGYSTFEVAIAVIQAFVFTLLITMYANDHMLILTPQFKIKI